MFACNRCSKRTFLPSRRMSRTLCPQKALKLTASVSSFFQTDDRRLDHCRNAGNREYRVRILYQRWPFHVAAAGLLDCLGDDDDLARAGVATQKRDAATNRTGNRTSGAGRKSRTAIANRA